MNWPLLRKFMNHVEQVKGQSKLAQAFSAVRDSLRYNISILEYYQFRFFVKDHNEKLKWAGTGFMYEYQLKMNPPGQRHILDDKTLFYKYYRPFFIHEVADLEDLEKDPAKTDKLLANPSGKLIFKAEAGKCGAEVEVRQCTEFDNNTLVDYLKKSPYDLVEEFIIQHPDINKLSPSAVNTVRVFTQLKDNNEIEILGSRQRISVNSHVDNLAAGNLAAPIDTETGKVNGPGVYSDITKPDEEIHPVTGTPINGFQVPHWPQIIKLVKEAALHQPQNRSIGWDVVVTEKGPGLIEGNHDWCKLLWQLPVKEGLKLKLVT